MKCARLSVVVGVLAVLVIPLSAQRDGTRRVFVHVTDAAGAPMADLTAGDFQVTEDGKPRKVVRAAYNVPMRVLLVVDTSSGVTSMINHVRSGIASFLEALPGTPEVGLVTVGSPFRIRVQPMADRQKLTATASGLSVDGGANTFIDSIMEADRRVLEPKPANNAWPVMVILTGDPPVRSELDVDRFNAWVQSLIKRGASAHTVVVRGSSTGVVGDVAQNITANLGGIFEAINSSTALPDYMKTIATRVAADAAAMTNRYEVEFQSDAKDSSGKLEVTLAKEGARVQLSGRRPF